MDVDRSRRARLPSASRSAPASRRRCTRPQPSARGLATRSRSSSVRRPRRPDRRAHRRVLGLDVDDLAVRAPVRDELANPWMIGVCGVIGYTGTTSGSICRIASATASPPVSSRGAIDSALIGTISIAPTGRSGAQLAPFAIVEIEARERRSSRRTAESGQYSQQRRQLTQLSRSTSGREPVRHPPVRG